MRMSDWSSYVCSSDLKRRSTPCSESLRDPHRVHSQADQRPGCNSQQPQSGATCQCRDTEKNKIGVSPCRDEAKPTVERPPDLHLNAEKIGRASYRERVCQYV